MLLVLYVYTVISMVCAVSVWQYGMPVNCILQQVILLLHAYIYRCKFFIALTKDIG